MDARKKKIIEALAVRMGWTKFKSNDYLGNWSGPEGQRSDAPPDFYESEADNSALVDFIANTANHLILIESWERNTAVRIKVFAGRLVPKEVFQSVSADRKTAIVECAAEALGESEYG